VYPVSTITSFYVLDESHLKRGFRITSCQSCLPIQRKRGEEKEGEEEEEKEEEGRGRGEEEEEGGGCGGREERIQDST